MGIKKLLVLSIFVYLAVFLNYSSLAGNKGYVILEILDAPPRIRDIAVIPEIAYTSSIMSCRADIYDENMSMLEVKYRWSLNGEFIEGSNKQLLEASSQLIQAGDNVACSIMAIDVYNHASSAVSDSIEIQPQGVVQTTGYAIRNIQGINSGDKGNLASAGAVILAGILVFLGSGLNKKF